MLTRLVNIGFDPNSTRIFLSLVYVHHLAIKPERYERHTRWAVSFPYQKWPHSSIRQMGSWPDYFCGNRINRQRCIIKHSLWEITMVRHSQAPNQERQARVGYRREISASKSCIVMEEEQGPQRFDPSSPIFLSPRFIECCISSGQHNSVKEVGDSSVNPLVAFLNNASMKGDDSDDEAPSTTALPVPWWMMICENGLSLEDGVPLWPDRV